MSLSPEAENGPPTSLPIHLILSFFLILFTWLYTFLLCVEVKGSSGGGEKGGEIFLLVDRKTKIQSVKWELKSYLPSPSHSSCLGTSSGSSSPVIWGASGLQDPEGK